MLHGILVATAAAFLLPLSGSHDNCPHDVVDPQGTDIQTEGDLNCGGMAQVSVAGVQVNMQATCPALVIVTPARDGTKDSPDSNTYTVPTSTVNVVQTKFTCATTWFLLFPVGSVCKERSSDTVNTLPSYSQFPCSMLPK